MRTIRFIGLAMFAYGAVMLVLLWTPYKDWALNHSIASFVAASDRRVGNSIDTAVDLPLAYAGSAVMCFAGLWFAFLVPWVMNRHMATMVAGVQQAAAELEAEQGGDGTVAG